MENALNAQNVELPAGALESTAKDFTIRVNRSYARPETSPRCRSRPAPRPPPRRPNANGVTNNAGIQQGYVTRLGDIARIEEGPNDRRAMFMQNGKERIGIGIQRQAQANDLQISKAVAKEVKEINATLPAGTRLALAVDWTMFTRDAIQEVWFTMGLSLIMVALVNFVFLGSWRAALIPSVVAPICILSTFIVLGPAGLLDQPSDPAGPGAGHRPGGRRRHRGGGEHPAPHRRGRAAPGRRRARARQVSSPWWPPPSC